MSIIPESDPRPPMISVIIPAYNSGATIERCMAALVAQRTLCRFEIIVVDSGEDQTCELARKTVPAVRTVHLEQRAIAPRARNIGARLARGHILAFIDSDAYADSCWIDGILAAADSGYDLVSGSIENANPGSAVSRAEQLLMFNEFLPDAPRRESWFSLSGNMVLLRSAFAKFGPFVELRAAEDVVFSRQLLAKGGTILFYPQLKVFHDNRTSVRRYLKNQLHLGKHTGIARRLVPFADSPSYLLFLLSLPASPVVKLAKVSIHLLRWDLRNARRIVRNFPLLFAGICAYCVGLSRAVFAQTMPIRLQSGLVGQRGGTVEQ